MRSLSWTCAAAVIALVCGIPTALPASGTSAADARLCGAGTDKPAECRPARPLQFVLKGIALGSKVPDSTFQANFGDYHAEGWDCHRKQPHETVDHYETVPIYPTLAPISCTQKTTLGFRDASLYSIATDSGTVAEIDLIFSSVIVNHTDFMQVRTDLESKFGAPTRVTKSASKAQWRSTDGSVMDLARSDYGQVVIRIMSAQGQANAAVRKQQADQARRADY